tara:strand:+ start:357 stop:833 length:477 start_codon:yes stop_codon:yes gene_type:complete
VSCCLKIVGRGNAVIVSDAESIRIGTVDSLSHARSNEWYRINLHPHPESASTGRKEITPKKVIKKSERYAPRIPSAFVGIAPVALSNEGSRGSYVPRDVKIMRPVKIKAHPNNSSPRRSIYSVVPLGRRAGLMRVGDLETIGTIPIKRLPSVLTLQPY